MGRRLSPESIARILEVATIEQWLEKATQQEKAQLLVELSHRFRDLRDERVNILTGCDSGKSGEYPIEAYIRGVVKAKALNYEIDGARLIVGSTSATPLATWRLYSELWSQVLTAPTALTANNRGPRVEYLSYGATSIVVGSDTQRLENNKFYSFSLEWKKDSPLSSAKVTGDTLNSFWSYFKEWVDEDPRVRIDVKFKNPKNNNLRDLKDLSENDIETLEEKSRNAPIVRLLAYLCFTIGNIMPFPTYGGKDSPNIRKRTEPPYSFFNNMFTNEEKGGNAESNWFKLYKEDAKRFCVANYLPNDVDGDIAKTDNALQACAFIIARGNRMREVLEEKLNKGEITKGDMKLWFND